MIVEKISTSLGLPESVIQALARKASHAYKVYTIPKRTGGRREIHHPSKELKALQRWLLYNVISTWPVHKAAVAYRRNVSIRDNAEIHVSSRYLLRLDLAKFFPSITGNDILGYLSDSTSTKNWSEADREFFTKVVCREGRLTIGAPTSPALANALCFELDRNLETMARAKDIVYTRYADDLFFSSIEQNALKDIPDMVNGILHRLKFPAGLTLNTAKTRHSSKKGRRQVTGLVLQSDGVVGLGRKRKRYIRSLVNGLQDLDKRKKSHLAGLLAFAQSVEPDFINALILKYGPDRVAAAQRTGS